MVFGCLVFLILIVYFGYNLIYGIIYSSIDTLNNGYFNLGILGLCGVAFVFFVFYLPNKTTEYPKNDVKDFKIPYKKVEVMNFYVEKKKSIYTIKFDKYSYDLNLKGYLFPLLYIKSFIIRNIRFIEISNRLPFRTLFRFKIKMTYCKIKNVKMHYKKKRYNLVKNSISRVTLMQNYINYVGYLGCIPLHRYDLKDYNNIKKINEKIYQRGY